MRRQRAVFAVFGTTLLLTIALARVPEARAQGAPEAPPPAEVPAAGGPAAAAPAAPAAPPASRVRDGVRVRGGFSVNAGLFFLPANPVGGAFGLEGRVGVQFNHYFALYYQNTPIVGVTVAHDKRSGTVVAADYNSLLFNVTLLHTFEIGLGPSLDYLGLAKGSIMLAGIDSTATAATGSGVAAGGHGRVAINIGGLSGDGPRRSGFSIGLDAHPMFLSTNRALSLTLGLGAEWY